jgi:UDP-N-acetylglucosamine--N-acetylmuramyl-(pentapeptide) pyrophosphoryl-undecaprenol N-acetylglucosamine transferase
MKVMFVSSTGGHLTELLHWSQRLRPQPLDAVWVTHERSNSAQIERIHPGVPVRFVPPVEPKQAGVALRMLPAARRMLREEAPDVVMSAGAAVAVPFAVAARMLGTPFHYLESAARLDGPSLTGKMITRIDGEHRWCQAEPAWSGWRGAGSLFDSFVAARSASGLPPRRVVVSLGTQANFGFGAAIESVVRVLSSVEQPPEVLWQIGSSDISDLLTDESRRLGLDQARDHIPEPELIEAMRAADVVITHAGVGLVTLALENGHSPVVLPRRASRREHTDDHQSQLATFLAARGLAVAAEAPALTWHDLFRAQQTTITTTAIADLPALVLS